MASTLYPTAPPAVKAAVAVLSAALAPILVSPIVPITRPATFIRVTRVGGGRLNMATDIARLLVECWTSINIGTGYAGAETLANQARHALLSAAGSVAAGVFIRGWRNEEGPVDFPDPDVTDMARFQFTGDLLVGMTHN